MRPPRENDESRRTRVGYGLATTVAVGVIAYFALFPFDFHRPAGRTLADALDEVDMAFAEDYVFLDLPVNVVLFVPFGFTCAGLLRALAAGPLRVRVGVVSAGVLVAFAFELLQALLLTRFASWSDVIANGLGAEILLRWGDGVVSWSATVAGNVVARSDLRRLALVGVAWFAAAVAVSAAAGTTTSLSGWDPAFPPLVVDAHLDVEQVRALSDGRSAEPPGGATVVVAHDFRSGLDGFPPLVFEGSGEGVVDSRGVRLGVDAWLRSPGSVEALSLALEESSAFTLLVDAAPSDLEQGGPARLVSISSGTLTRNLTVGQEGHDLVVRMRTRLFGPDGTAPELVVPDVSTDRSPHRLVVRFDGSTISATVDVPEGGSGSAVGRSMELAPEVAGLLATFPNEITAKRLGPGWVLLGTYRMLIFLPVTFAAAMMVTRRVAGGPIGAVVVGTLVTTGFEAALATMIAAYDRRVARLVLSTSVVAFSTSAVLLCARMLSRSAGPGRHMAPRDEPEARVGRD